MRVLQFSLILLVACFTSCKEAEEEQELLVSGLEVNYTITDEPGVFLFNAKANNAKSYTWYANNKEIASGSTMEYNYYEHIDLTIICEAKGESNAIRDTTNLNIETDLMFISEVEKILCGYDKETGNNTVIWYWGANKPKILSGGPKTYFHTHDSAIYSLFDPIDQSLWFQDYLTLDVSYDDAYSFNLKYEYSCDYKTNGFCLNWAYAYHRYGINSTIYVDEATHNLPQTGKWKITIHEHADYAHNDMIANAPKTLVNGVPENKAYYLEIFDGAYLMQENAEPKYQILRIDNDTVFLRWEVGIPEDFDTSLDAGWIYPDWIDYAPLQPGVGEWMYGYLVKQESTPQLD